MHKFSGTMGFQRLIKTIKRTSGTPEPTSVSSSAIIDGTISTADISNGAITSFNIADGTIQGSNIAVETITSSNILNGTIVNADISDNTIEIEKLATELQSKINDAGKLRGLITIRNDTIDAISFSYTLVYNVSGDPQFASYTKLYHATSTSHYFVLPTLTTLIRLEIDTTDGYLQVDTIDVIYGGSIYYLDVNFADIAITDNNVMITAEVSIAP